MSPEQARAEPLDGRADLYSAAIILYQLVTGDIPFKADSPMGIVSRHLAEVPKAPSLRRPDLPIPKALDELILRGMEKSREERYPTAARLPRGPRGPRGRLARAAHANSAGNAGHDADDARDGPEPPEPDGRPSPAGAATGSARRLI